MSRAFKQPQVHILGEILGGTGFPTGVSCRWALEAGGGTTLGRSDVAWEKSEGQDSGQTQVDYPEDGSGDVVWCHPIDVQYLAGSMKVRQSTRSWATEIETMRG